MPLLAAGPLIAVVLGVIGLEMLALLVFARRGHQQRLMRQMIPGTAAGLCLALALRDLVTGGTWLPLWLLGAGAAHALDWWQRLQQSRT